MKNKFSLVVLGSLLTFSAAANERLFTYTYEPETMPKGGWEYEQWVTWRTQRTKAVDQDKFNRWEFRNSVEYGVTDNYTAEIYLNSQQESFHDPSAGVSVSDFRWKGISLENRLM